MLFADLVGVRSDQVPDAHGVRRVGLPWCGGAEPVRGERDVGD